MTIPIVSVLPKECNVTECSRPAKNSGMCWKHYERNRKHGDVNYNPPNDIERFFANIDKSAPNGCWEWTAFRAKGYGRIVMYGVCQRAHRASWVIHNGGIPDGMLVLHKCDNPPCVNPNHLFLGTHKDNAIDRENKGRGNAPKGSKHVLSKLTEAQVMLILLDTRPYKVIAKEHSVSISLVCLIKQRKVWKHVGVDHRC